MAANTDNLDPNTVFVRNINYKTTDETLKNEFTKYGEVERARILTDRYHGQSFSRGTGFVHFTSPDTLAKVLAEQNIVVDGRTLKVSQARKKVERKRDTAFISGIPAGTTIDQIKEAFNGYNPVDAKIVYENRDQRRGFAFVKFATPEDQTRAVTEKRDLQLNGEQSRVIFARKDFDAPPRPRTHRRRFGRRRFARKRAQRSQAPANPQ